MRRTAFVSFALFAAALCGCPAPNPPATFQSESHGHSHEGGNWLLEDAGRYHAALSAHLSSKEGNELDVKFETVDTPPKPVPLPLESFRATAKTADGKEHVLEFTPAPKEERKGDSDGKCSHFSAKAGWMKPEDTLVVTTTVPIDGKERTITWKDFNPKKYAHHEE
ncbi:hypothetical protein [Frigoriglobus tundricola]|uniref:Lipoprotein n=1 Tax=Frigoriglobus tundricola TaxID=2774151 RepID=A0A6M5YG59_9BACT|nr:hypothetical protein [Frigoriglobus tundricola]QJW93017.1 hypothetical protein FTUN_0517 [Frigoriglobus tundricola]